MLNGFSGVQSTLCQGFAGINDAITQNSIADMQATFGLQNAITAGNTALTAQLNGMAAADAACCCETQRLIDRNFCDLNYNLATQACDTRRAIADSTRDIIDFLTQDKIASLQAENQSLKFAASQQAQNSYLISKLTDPCPVPAYMVPNPNCCYTPAFGYKFLKGKLIFNCKLNIGSGAVKQGEDMHQQLKNQKYKSCGKNELAVITSFHRNTSVYEDITLIFS